MGTRWPETCWATYKEEINIILKVTSSWSLYPHWIICHLCSSKTFRPLQGHHQGGIYRRLQIQQIMSNVCVCRVKHMNMLDIISSTCKPFNIPPWWWPCRGRNVLEEHKWQTIVFDFKLSPCSKCSFLSFWWFPGVLIWCPEHSVRSIFIVHPCEDGAECFEKSAHRIQPPGNHQKERIEQIIVYYWLWILLD